MGFTKIIESVRPKSAVRDDGRFIYAKSIALTKKNRVGITHVKEPLRRMPSQSKKHKRRGKFFDGHLDALQGLVDYAKNTFYDGDSARLATHSGLYTNDCKHLLERYFFKYHPDVCSAYERRYHRKIYGHLLANRIAFLFTRWVVLSDGTRKKITGQRSKEHPSIIV